MPTRPNVLMIVMDSLRADHTSLLGHRRLTTPHIDRFARGGVVFANAFSPHIPTTPAFASMVTGRDCFGTGIVSLRDSAAVRTPTLAQVLSAEGYATSSIGRCARRSAWRNSPCPNCAAWRTARGRSS
jgi:arylsulfatase A-like enzyme